MIKKKHLIWSFIIILSLLTNAIFYSVSKELIISQSFSNYLLLSLHILLNIIFGAALGLNVILTRAELRHKNWHLDLSQLMIITIPAFILSLLPFAPLTPFNTLANFYLNNPSLVLLIQILCGYSLITSFDKSI